jgi:hypothetical protein
MLGGDKIIFDLHELERLKGASVTDEKHGVSPGSMHVILEVVAPHAILAVGVV